MGSRVTLGFLKSYEAGCGRDLWMILNMFIKNLSGKIFYPSWLSLVFKCQTTGIYWESTYVSGTGGTEVNHTDTVPDFGLKEKTM